MPKSILRKFSVSLVLASSAVFAQVPTPAFEVASIKPAAPLDPAKIAAGQLHVGMTIDGARVDIGFFSLADLIRTAYNVKPYQVTGPDWMSAQRFDMVAKMPEGASKDQVPQMLQALLAERFKLTVHRDSKEHSVYALMVGKNGPKLKESPPDADPAPSSAPGGGDTPAPGSGNGPLRVNRSGNGMVISGGRGGATRVSMGPNGTIHMEVSKMAMPAFADMLSPFVDRPVVDMTELKGNYQVALDLSLDDMRIAARSAGVAVPGLAPGGEPSRQSGLDAPAASDPSGSSIFAAVQQLGLKLDPRKAPMEMIVIDHLEKAPTEN